MKVEKINYENTDLKREIVYICGSLEKFADLMGMSYQNIYNKLNNKVEWTRSDITKACEILHIEDGYKLNNLFFRH